MSPDIHAIDSHKLDLHPERVASWLSNKQATFPIYVEISPVGYCNHRCTFCAVDYIGYQVRKLATKALQDTLLNMATHGVKSIMYAGEGEPLLHPDIAKIINYTNLCGIDVGVTSNGVAMTEQFLQETHGSIKWIKLSVNAGTPECYSEVHNANEKDWYKLWDNIGRTRHVRNEEGSIRTTLGIQTVLLPENIDTIEALAYKCREYGVDYLVLKPYSQHLASKDTAKRYAHVNWTDMRDKMNRLSYLRINGLDIIARTNTMDNYVRDDRGYCKCHATPYFWAYIMATGDVYGCSAYLLDKRFCYGNINEESFNKIWMGKKRVDSMRYVEDKLDIKECRKNCRMDKVNKYLDKIVNKPSHANFV